MSENLLDNEKAARAGIRFPVNIHEAKNMFASVYDLLKAFEGTIRGTRNLKKYPIENNDDNREVLSRIANFILGLDMLKGVDMRPVMNRVLGETAEMEDTDWFLRPYLNTTPFETFKGFKDIDDDYASLVAAAKAENENAYNRTRNHLEDMLLRLGTENDVDLKFMPHYDMYLNGVPDYERMKFELWCKELDNRMGICRD